MEGRKVRGRPRPHPSAVKGFNCGRGRPRTTPPPNTGRCADVPVRIRAASKVQLRAGTPAHHAAAEHREVRGRPRPHSGSSKVQLRAGTPAHHAAAEHWEVRGRPRPHPALCKVQLRAGTPAHHAAAEHGEVRGRPRPHPALCKVQLRAGTPAHHDAAEHWEVRGRPRPHSGAVQGFNCGRGRPRTPPPPNTGRCADVPVRIRAASKVQLRAGTPAHHDAAEPREVRGRPRPHPCTTDRARRSGSLRRCGRGAPRPWRSR